MVSNEILNIVESAVNALGYELVGCELVQQHGKMVLRIYIDSEDGITLGDCTAVSRQVGAVMEVDNPTIGKYDLEVSSPGLDRPLFKLEHYQRFVGNRIKLRLKLAKDNQRNFTGILTGAEENKITLDLGSDKILTIDLNEIDRANLVPEF